MSILTNLIISTFAAILELKNTAYRHFKVTVIGSRDQLCINDSLVGKSNTDKIYACKKLMNNSESFKSPTCKYYHNIADRPNYFESVAESMFEQEPNQYITDIEDLRSHGHSNDCCPYFLSKKVAENANIIFLPYSYLIDPILRAQSEIDLNDAIVILDEAHNVSQVCEDSSSSFIEIKHVLAASRDVKKVKTTVMYYYFT